MPRDYRSSVLRTPYPVFEPWLTASAIFAFVVVANLYIASYFTLLEPRPTNSMSMGRVYPTYKRGGEVARRVFAPAYATHDWLNRRYHDVFGRRVIVIID